MKKTGLLISCILLVGTLAACGKTQTGVTAPTKQATPLATTHTHETVATPRTEKEPQMLYCGNTMTTIRVDNQKYGFDGERSVTLTDLLLHLQYTEPVCDCLPEYVVDTEFGTDYGINLTENYVRHDGKQVTLTKEQHDTIAGIIAWAKDNVDTVLIGEDEGAEK